MQEIISLIRNLSPVGVIFICIVLAILIYLGEGLARIAAMLKGRPFETLTGRLDFIGRVFDTPPRHEIQNARFILDSTGQTVTVGTLRFGSTLRYGGLVGVGTQGTWFFRGRPGSKPHHYKTMRLYAYSDGRQTQRSPKDIPALENLDGNTRAVFLIVAAGLFVLAWAHFQRWPFNSPAVSGMTALVIGLATVLTCPVGWYLLERLACRKAQATLDRQLRDIERLQAGSSRPEPAVPQALPAGPLPPPAATNASSLAGAASFVPFLNWVFYLYSLLRFFFVSAKSLASVFARPRFETRPFCITALGGAPVKSGEWIEYPQTTLSSPEFGERTIARLLVAEALANNARVRIGQSGLWVMRAAEISPNRTPRRLYLVAAHDGEYLIYSRSDALEAYGHTPLTPVLAAFWGLIAGLIGIHWFYGLITFDARLLWLLPAMALPGALLILTRRRILNAFQRELERTFQLTQSTVPERL